MKKGLPLKMNDSICLLKGVGEKRSKILGRMDIYKVRDLLQHYPRTYDVFEEPILINEISEEKVLSIKGTITHVYPIKQVRNLKITSCKVTDETGSINITWFNMPYLKNQLRIGSKSIFRGRVNLKNGMFVIEQPKIYSDDQYKASMNVLQPIYPLSAGITNNTMIKIMKIALKETDFTKDYLPERIREKYQLVDYQDAVKEIHFPSNKNSMVTARKRFVFDEFFLFTLVLQSIKDKKIFWHNNFNITDKKECSELIQNLPYHLTNAQLRAWEDIKADLFGTGTMNRLIQGDVGSGKTIVASLALLLCGLNGYQGCIMVPTEVLAKQHYHSLSELFSNYGVQIELLVGSMTPSMKKNAYKRIKTKETQIVVGTHALIQDKVEFSNLALVVTDEQHRFGVRQRENLAGKGTHPHVLVMSATPIPRTLAIILYSDLDISVIDELPSNRLPIKNCVVDISYRKTAYKFMEKQVLEGRQVYVICPMVEESDIMDGENVIDYTTKLRNEISKQIRIEYLHGKMKGNEKNEIMERFSNGDIQILVSTTVIEVGINVPNATVMMIENAERFGLAQLHQLRGRVGRGKYQSYCILVSGSKNKETMKRLEILNHSNDGFHIASEDLKLRGPGDMLGIRQSGDMEFKIGDIYHDSSVLIMANEAAKSITLDEMDSIQKEYPPLLKIQKNFHSGTL